MGYGPISVFSGTIASGASTSGEINLGRAWSQVYLNYGTMSTAMNMTVFAASGSSGSGATYRVVYQPPINSATVACSVFTITSTVGVAGGIVPIPSGFQYIKAVLTGVVSGGLSVSVICSDNA